MCGFAGLINFDELKHDSSLEKKMNAALGRLHPRGPDKMENGKIIILIWCTPDSA